MLQKVLLTRWAGYLVGLASVATMSGLIGLALSYRQIGGLFMLYLIAVLAIAVIFGRGPAIIASLAAFLTFVWFFTEPLHTFAIAAPEEWIGLLLFLTTAGVVGQVAAAQRQRAEEAEQRKRDALVLYDVVSLMSERDLGHALQAVAEHLYKELQLAGVSIEIADRAIMEESKVTGKAMITDGSEPAVFQARPGTSVETLGEGQSPTAGRRGEPGRWVRIVPPGPPGVKTPSTSDRLNVVPVRVHGRRVGDLLLARRAGAPKFTPAEDRLLSAVATQLGMAVERVKLQREATEAEILRRTDELKTALLNAVSHDLRTPLASIIASAGSLRERDVSWTEEEQQEFAASIEEEALRLNQIVGNLLDLSRLEGGILRAEKGYYDLGALVDDVVGRLRMLSEKHRIVIEIPEDLPPVPLDYVEIDRVLSNLIENAVKYTSPGTEIKVSADRSGKEVRVTVADSGPGVPPEAMPRLFEPFFRAGGEAPRPKGTGLGLAVAKGLVEAHGGRIWAENRPGGGAQFSFTLPLMDSVDHLPMPEDE